MNSIQARIEWHALHLSLFGRFINHFTIKRPGNSMLINQKGKYSCLKTLKKVNGMQFPAAAAAVPSPSTLNKKRVKPEARAMSVELKKCISR